MAFISALSQIRDSLIRLTATIEILMYIYKRIVVFFSLQHGQSIQRRCLPKKNVSRILPFFFLLPFSRSLARSLSLALFLSFSSLTLQSRIRILELHTRSHSLNVEGSRFHIYLLYSFSLYGKSIKDYWFSFCICACLSSFPFRIPSVIRFGFVGPVWQCLVN